MPSPASTLNGGSFFLGDGTAVANCVDCQRGSIAATTIIESLSSSTAVAAGGVAAAAAVATPGLLFTIKTNQI